MIPRILTEQDIRSAVGFGQEELQAVETSFVWASSGRAEIPPVLHLEVTEAPGDVDIKTAYVRGESRFAIKIASGFFGNGARGLPTGSGLMTVFSAETGFCEAVLLDNGYLTDLRTALAGAVAARYLALEKLTTVGVIGCGVQARLQMRALALVRDFQRLLVWGRNPERAKEYQEEMLSELGCEVALADSPEALVRQSQCVVTTTPTREPLIQASWIHPGLHITAMGSDLPGKQELEANILRLADRLVCDLRPQAQRLGELQHLEPQESLGAIELGELVSGEKLGRLDDDAITVCDLSGIGVQDTAIALLTLRRAEEQGHGLPAKAEV